MWQGFVLLYLLFSSGQDIVDKAAIVRDVRIDTLSASFWRVFLYTFLTIIIGLLGLFGPLGFSLHGLILLNGLLGAISALIWTYFLKHLEITGSIAIGYLSPLLFLVIDAFLVETPLVFTDVLGIFFLVVGGCTFVFDLRRLRLKKAFSARVLVCAAFSILIAAAEAYAFQYLETSRGMNEITFLSSVWTVATILLFSYITGTGRFSKLLYAAKHNHYLLKVSLSKGADTLSSIFWLKALAIAPVSKVTAFASLYPLVLLCVTPLAQRVGIELREDLRRRTFVPKLFGALCLIVGTLLL